MLSESTLKAAIEAETTAISRLNESIGDELLRLLLQSASNTLSFVSMAFLAPNVMERLRTPAELEKWFGHAAKHIERATQIRREVEQAASLGPDAG
jgi:hypothetical protein